ncbi:MAG: hypothetical protein Q9227_000774 [Pyrenula ochraceoflavens]
MGTRDKGPSVNTHDTASNKSTAPKNQPQTLLGGSAFADLSSKIKKKIEQQSQPKSKTKGEKLDRNGGNSQTHRPREEGRGRKRDSSGKVVNGTSKDEKLPKSKSASDVQALREEINLLGGTSEDFDLVNNIDSASELEDGESGPIATAEKSQIEHKSFKKDLSTLLEEFSHNKDLHDLDSGDDETGLSEESSERSDGEPGNAPAIGSFGNTATPSNAVSFKLAVDPQPDWIPMTEKSTSIPTQDLGPVSPETMQNLENYAQTLLDKENAEFLRSQQTSKSSNFYNQVIISGTLTDKISALTLAVQESPIHNVKALESLMALAKKRSRAQAIEVLRALKDLFSQGNLLPSNRRLRLVAHQPLILSVAQRAKGWKLGHKLPTGISQQLLIAFAYEQWLKGVYFEFLKILETWSNDELEYSKARAISYNYELLKEKPEEEANLLRMLVNKLGDPVKKIASRTSYLILQLQGTHPLMKETIINAIDSDILLRPNQSLHATYYAIITLNQTVLSTRDESIAAKLLQIYFRWFVVLLNSDKKTGPERPKPGKTASKGKLAKKAKTRNEQTQEGELREKVISAILTGVNRAYPYAGADPSALSDHMETLFRITHSSNFNTSVQAMMLIQQLSSTHQVASDHFYRTLYESLLDARLANSSKQALYMNLLYKALKSDLSVNRVKAFVKRILQILTLHQPSFICGAIYLLHELTKTFPSISLMISQSEEHDSEIENFRDIDDNQDGNSEARPPSATQREAEIDGHNFYDAHKRDPLHANADSSSLWDLLPFLSHYHPTVSLNANHLLTSNPLPGKPDLNLHTLSHFLDRFVHRNPKTKTAKVGAPPTRGSSIMQPMANSTNATLLVGGKVKGGRAEIPVNLKTGKEIGADDVFFHRYFEALGKSKGGKKGKEKHAKQEKERDEEDAESDNDEDEVWKAMMESRPDLEGGMEDSDMEDLQMSDLESEFSRSASGEEATAETEQGDQVIAEEDVGFGFEDDEEDLLSDDDEIPEIEAMQGLGSEAKSGSELGTLGGKNSRTATKRRKLKHLPTFASVEDYEKMLGGKDEEEDMG